jgi:hypothetical protein
MLRSLPLAACCALLSLPATAALTVNETPGNFIEPITEVVVTESVNFTPGVIDFSSFSFEQTGTSSSLRLGGIYLFRGTDNPDTSSGGVATSTFNFYQVNRLGEPPAVFGPPTGYSNGAQQGTDNWIYITTLAGERAWAQVDIQEDVITPVKYVYDPANRTAEISLPDAVNAVPEASSALLSLLAAATLLRRRRA